uniref:Uncharacterized protein n=1 Tax=Emiliania huxleyi TaxID=2903 RepID=A0A6V2XPR5_EMIHU
MGVKMPSLFLALLASAAAAPATKGRPRATEPPSPPATPPKIRYVVTEEKQTNVATTKGGARAPACPLGDVCTTGPCLITDGGSCATSPDFPNDYPNLRRGLHHLRPEGCTCRRSGWT